MREEDAVEVRFRAGLVEGALICGALVGWCGFMFGDRKNRPGQVVPSWKVFDFSGRVLCVCGGRKGTDWGD